MITLPDKTIGIIGGGQLGKMMALEAKAMGYKVIILDPANNSPASQVSDRQVVATYDDVSALEELCRSSDVITYEFENVNSEVIESLEKIHNIPQKSNCLKVSQHRFLEKNHAKQCGVPCIEYRLINCEEDLQQAIKELGFPTVLKTARNGYDGKGQFVLKGNDDIKHCKKLLEEECVLEKFITFDKEISVVVTRSEKDITYFPIGENIHHNGILRYSLVPANISLDVKNKAQEIACKLVESLDYIGTFAVELFFKDNDLYFNEMAPRPHNSAHYTIEGCNQSQFHTHIKAICGLPLFPAYLKQPTVMLNIFGQDMSDILNYIQHPHKVESYLHLYGKEEAVQNRKMGHLTFCGEDIETLFKEAHSVIKGD